MGKLSICIPTRNRAALLARHLFHIASFEKLNYEVVISDNCSDGQTKETQEVVERWRNRLPYVHYMRQTRPLNFYETQVAVCNVAAGDYIICAADDDFLVEAGLLRAVEIMDNDPGISAVYGAWVESSDKIDTVVHAMVDSDRMIGPSGLLALFAAHDTPEIPIFRASTFQQTHVPTIHQFAFDFLGAALFQHGGNIMLIPDLIVKVTQHQEQASRGIYRPEVLQAYLADYELFLSHYPEVTPQSKSAMIVNAMTQQYLAAADAAYCHKKYLIARTMLVRLSNYLGDGLDANIVEFDDKFMMHMVAESLHGFIETCPPVNTVLIQADGESEIIASRLKECGVEAEIKVLSSEELLDRPLEETDFLLYNDTQVYSSIQMNCKFPIRKRRRLRDLLDAITVGSKGGFKIDHDILQGKGDGLARTFANMPS